MENSSCRKAKLATLAALPGPEDTWSTQASSGSVAGNGVCKTEKKAEENANG